MQEEKKAELVPGPRQTITVVDLPGHGRGRLVWRNGPAFFMPDEGDPFPVYRADSGGARKVSENKSFSWERVQITRDGPVLEAETLEPGEHHDRHYSTIFGDGWLVWERGPGWWHRFETLDGEVKVRFKMLSLSVGRPTYAKKMERSHSRMPAIDDPDEMNWSTYSTDDGSVLAFRREGPPPPEGTFIPVRADTYKLLTPKARKAYDAAKKAHEEAMARAAGAPPPEQLTLPIR